MKNTIRKKVLGLGAGLLGAGMLASCSLPSPTAKPGSTTAPTTQQGEAVKGIKQLSVAPLGLSYKSSYELFNDPLSQLQTSQEKNFAELLKTLRFFSADSFELLFAKHKAGKNLLYAPVSLYMDLAMLADAASAQTAKDLEGALNPADTLDREARALAIAELMRLFNREVTEENAKSQLSNALWLKEGLGLKSDYRDRLEKTYHADTYTWGAGSEDQAHEEIGRWVEDKTNKLITADSLPKPLPAPNDALILINALYYKSNWQQVFSEGMVEKRDFHYTDGSKAQLDFLVQKNNFSRSVLRDDYNVGVFPMTDGAEMRFLLPDESVDPQTLVNKSTFWADLLQNNNDSQDHDVVWGIPKSDVKGELDLLPLLDEMGLSSLLQNMTLDGGLDGAAANAMALSAASQSVRIKMHEKGVEAAAVTIMTGTTSMPEPKPELDMNLDRPFFCALVNQYGVPVFVAYIETPGMT